MKKLVLSFLLCFITTNLFAWISEKPALSFPEIKPISFYPKKIKSKSRQASEYFLAVKTAPINTVNRNDPSVIEPPLTEFTEIIEKKEIKNLLNPEYPKLTYDEKGMVEILDKDVKQEFKRTYISQNKYLSMMETSDSLLEDEVDDLSAEPLPSEIINEQPPLLGVEETDEISESDDDFNLDFIDEDLEEETINPEQPEKSLVQKVDEFEEESEVSEKTEINDAIKILQMKVSFNKNTTALTGKNVHLISSFAQVALNNPTNAVEISISNKVLNNLNKKKKSAERLALISRILKDHGLSKDRIRPVLTSREENSFVLRITNKDAYDGYQIPGDEFSDLIRTRAISVQEW